MPNIWMLTHLFVCSVDPFNHFHYNLLGSSAFNHNNSSYRSYQSIGEWVSESVNESIFVLMMMMMMMPTTIIRDNHTRVVVGVTVIHYETKLLVTRIFRLFFCLGGGVWSLFGKKWGVMGAVVCFKEWGETGSRHSTIRINLTNSKVLESPPPVLDFDSPQQSKAANTRGMTPLPHFGFPTWFDGNLSLNAACFVL